MAHPQTTTTTTTVAAAAATARQCRSSCGCVGRLLRKLKKQSNKMLCIATRPAAAFNCHYDPLSYARNFDHDGNGGDSSHLFYTSSSRFVAAAKPQLVQGNNVAAR